MYPNTRDMYHTFSTLPAFYSQKYSQPRGLIKQVPLYTFLLTLWCVFPRGKGAGRGVRSREEEAGFPGEVAGSSQEEVTSPAPYPGVEARRGNLAHTRLQTNKYTSL